MATFNLTVYGFEKIPSAGALQNVVARVYWRYTGTDGVNETSVMGSTDLAEPGSDSFVQFDQLTEAQVKNWVLASTDPQSWVTHEVLMADWLAAQTQPKIVAVTPPWVPTDE